MSDHESLAKAQAVLRDLEAGAYDAQLGVTPADRDLLTRATDPQQRLTLADLRALNTLNRPDLIDAARLAGRIDITPNGA